MRVTGRRGRLRLQLEAIESSTLGTLLDELTELVQGEITAGGGPDDAVIARLFPSAYPDDDVAEADYRSITESGLRGDRVERIAACRADLARSRDIDLADADTAQRWIQTLNDLRLALGTRIGVTEDEPEFDPDEPQAQPRLLYYWLTAVQDSVVTGLMG